MLGPHRVWSTIDGQITGKSSAGKRHRMHRTHLVVRDELYYALIKLGGQTMPPERVLHRVRERQSAWPLERAFRQLDRSHSSCTSPGEVFVEKIFKRALHLVMGEVCEQQCCVAL